jgi:probable phosphoglycerate mutase
MPTVHATHATLICLVRHGETDWNTEKRLQGQIDIDLNAVGVTQARAVRPGLQGQQFAAIYSSDLVRAWRTAQIASADLGVAVTAAPDLRERHYGVYQGLTSTEAAVKHPEIHSLHQSRSPDFDYLGGESLADFAERVMSGLTVLADRHRGQRILGFTHGGVLDVVYRAAVGRTLETPRDFSIPNAALNWLEYTAGTHAGHWRLVEWANIAHLRHIQEAEQITEVRDEVMH